MPDAGSIATATDGSSASEFPGADADFARLDRDRDGALTGATSTSRRMP